MGFTFVTDGTACFRPLATSPRGDAVAGHSRANDLIARMTTLVFMDVWVSGSHAHLIIFFANRCFSPVGPPLVGEPLAPKHQARLAGERQPCYKLQETEMRPTIGCIQQSSCKPCLPHFYFPINPHQSKDSLLI